MLAYLRRLPFWSLGLISAALYLLLAFWFPLQPNYNLAPLADIFALAMPWWQGVLYGLLLTVLFVVYLLAWRQVRAVARPAGHIVATATLFSIPLLLTFPINATDIYRYFIRGRVASLYGASPYSFPPSHFTQDPYLPLAGEWADFTSPYGPLWELWAFVATTLARWLSPGSPDLFVGLMLFKLLSIAAFLGTGYLIYQIWQKRRLGKGSGPLLLWLWNPALLLTFVANGHNDSLLLFWFVLGWYWAVQRRSLLAWSCFMLALLTKPVGLLALPFLFIYLWRREWASGRLWRFGGGAGVISLVLVLSLFWPFGSPVDLAIRLIAESRSFPGFSPVTLLILIRYQLSGPGPFADLTTGALALFALASLYLVWLAFRGRSAPRGAADIFYAFVLQATSYRIWYAAWPFPWLLLDDQADKWRRNRLSAGILYLYLSQLSVVIHAHMRIYLFGGHHLWSHLVATPLVFVGPLIWLWWAGRGADGVD